MKIIKYMLNMLKIIELSVVEILLRTPSSCRLADLQFVMTICEIRSKNLIFRRYR